MINDRNHLRLCKSKRQPPWKKPKVDTAVLVCLVVIPRDTVYKGLFFTAKCEQCHWKCRWKIKEHAEDLQLAHSSLKDIQGEDLLVSAKSSMATFANESVHSKKQVQDIRDAEHNLNTSGLNWRRTCGNICGISTQRTSLAGSVSPAVTTWSHLRAVPTWESKQWKVHHTRLSSRIQQLLKS